jgi:hypothetical protein
MFLFKKKEVEVEYIPPTEKRLYVLVEEQKQGLIQYLHENGVEVYYISSKTSELMDEVMLDEHPVRLLIIDSNKGRFDDKKELVEIESLVEIVTDADGYVSMFSNMNHFNVIKKHIVTRTKSKADKIVVYKSAGAVDILTYLADYNEVYVEGGAKDVIPEDVLGFRPDKVQLKDKEKQALSNITREIYDIDMHSFEDENEESIPRYGRAVKHY